MDNVIDLADDRMVRPKEAAHILGISRSTLYALVDAGRLEAPQPIGLRAVGWPMSVLRTYLERARRAPRPRFSREQLAA